MNGPIKIDPERIPSLDSNDFTRLYNDLLRAEAGRLHLPQENVDTTVRDKAPDGGIDCRVTSAPPSASQLIPEGDSVHQLKGGGAPSLKDVRGELVKPEAQAALARGDAYVLAIADALTARRKKSFLDAINAEYLNRGLTPRGHVYTADEIAYWSAQHPAIAVRVFDTPISGWYAIDFWERQGQYGNPFVAEPARLEVIGRIRQGLATDERLIRIVGTAGAGKSRTVLEAVRIAGISERVLYAPDAAHVSPEFFWYLTSQNSSGSGVLVIDEATPEEVARLRSLIDLLPTNYTVVAVGPLQFGVAGPSAIEVPVLDVDTLDAIIESLVPALPAVVRRAIARRCGGSPKLAVLIGTELAQDPSRMTSWEVVEHSADVVEYVNSRIFPLGTTDPAAIAMRAVSLFTRLGWREELSSEGRFVVEFLRGDWRQVRLAAETLVQRGVLSPRGRYLYPTPDILANYLARETLRALGADLRELFSGLPETAQRSFAERLRQLGDEAATRDVVITILGDAGFFGGLADLNDPHVAGLLHQLVPAYPELTLRQLERSVGAATREELLSFGGGRRHIVWALEALAWWGEYFTRTARLLQRLAWAETESIANNATGIWQRLFQPWLGGTSAPYSARLEVLDEILGAEDPLRRCLGVKALLAALQTQRIMRFGGPPENTGMLPPPEWQPTDQEWADIIRMSLMRLANALFDSDAGVRSEAAGVVAHRAAELIHSGFVAEWAEVALQLTEMPFENRKLVLDVLSAELGTEGRVSPQELELLVKVEAALQGVAFSDRLRRVVGSWDYEFERHGERGTGTDAIDHLVREVIASPDVIRPELAWLSGGDASSGWLFGKRLGVLDDDESLKRIVEEGWEPDVRDERFFAGYFAGVAERRGNDWLEELLDQWTAEPQQSIAAAVVTWHVLSTDRAARRLARTIRAGWVPASFLRRMISGFWARDVSPVALSELVDAAASDQSKQAVSGRVVLLAQYLDQNPERVDVLRTSAMRTLEEGATGLVGRMEVFYWGLLAKLFLPAEAVWIAELCVRAAANYNEAAFSRIDEQLRKVLQEAVESGGWDVFQGVIGPALIADRRLLWTLLDPFRGRQMLRSLPPEQLMGWIAESVEDRLPLIANAIPITVHDEDAGEFDEKTILAPLARALLNSFGDHDEVRRSLAATLLTGVWMGPESKQMQKWIAVLDRWARDSDANVRRWAQELADDQRKRLPRVLLREEEEL